ncbi:MAG: zinc-binding alcohol dehydrogenase [Clostridia bacterium]|nr:zinc-binding alcohol dehydrogenase [Clostridia bacterium]
MKNLTISFTEPRVVELIGSPVEAPPPGKVQVELAVSTMSSGTERANLEGNKSLNINAAPGAPTFPRVLGYSSAGTVTAVGEGVTGIEAGQRVALSWSVYRRFLNIDCANVYPIPDSVSFEDAAYFHIATFPLAAIRKCRLELGESAIVMGMGILGLTAVKLLRLAGAAPVIAVDPNEEKRKKALSCGADFALDPFAPDFASKAKELTGCGAKVGIEVTGIGAGLDGILDCMARFGRVALLGCTRSSDFTIDYYRKVHGPGITLIGAHTRARPEVESHPGWWTQDDDMNALIKLTATGRLKLSEMIDERYSPMQAKEVFARLLESRSFPLVQFDWRLIGK